eukprot:XP_006538880.1 PREDICTED: uncharacterized protein C1orf127 homolog isoform X3 [Mus musculus]
MRWKVGWIGRALTEGMGLWKEQWPQGDLPASPGVEHLSGAAAVVAVSSQPGSEISVHIPKQRLGLVKRGSLVEESLSPRFLQVQQTDTFTVAEDRDFVIVSIPSMRLLQDQPCQKARESPGTQAFYRVDLSLDFAEMDSPVHWTVENFFQCVGSREDSLFSTVTPRTTLPTQSPGWETTPAETPPAASPPLQTPQMAVLEEPPQHFVHQSAKESTKQELAAAFMQITRPARGSWVSMASPSSSAMQEHQGPQTPPEKADLSPHPQTPATLSSEHTEVSQAGPGPSHYVSLAPNSLSTHLSSEITSSLWPSWPSDGPPMLLSSEPSVKLTEVPRATRAGQDSIQPSRSPFPPGELSRETVNSTESTEPIPREPAYIREEFPPFTKSFMSSLAEEGLIFHPDPKRPQERPIVKAEKPLQNDHGPSGEETRHYLDLSTSEPSQEMKELGVDATFTTSRRRQPDARAYLGTSRPELTGRPRVGTAALQTTLHKGLLASTSERPAAPSEGALQLESAPSWPEGWHDLGAAHTASPLSSHTHSPLVPTQAMFPGSDEPGNSLPGSQGSVESRLLPTTDSHQSPEL